MRILKCACCGEDVTMPSFKDGKPYFSIPVIGFTFRGKPINNRFVAYSFCCKTILLCMGEI